MKNIYILLMFLLIFISCNDILKEQPKAIAVATYYNTSQEIESGVNAIYMPYRQGNTYQSLFPVILDVLTDLYQGTIFWNDGQNYSTPTLGFMNGIWGNMYLSIRNANLIIKNAPNGSDISKEDVTKYVSEAKFMRALSYFHLVRLWGKVPIRKIENMTESDVPKSTENEVFQFIIDDLKDAESNLPDKPNAVGRPSKWSAKTVLADVYFYKGLNAEASAKAKEVIESGKYSLVEVKKWEDFDSKLYGTNVIGSSESIFSIMFSKSSTSLNSTFFIVLNYANSPYSGGRGNSSIFIDTLSQPLYSNWNNKDIRKDLWYSADFGEGKNTMVSRKFIDPNANGGGSGIDFPLYRYADLLLIYAEASCLANNGPTADGMEALNKVHRRAYGKNPPTQPSDIDFKLTDYDAKSFANLVIKERGYETMVEGKRWFDLKRIGKVAEYIKANRGIDIAGKLLLWPIPNTELQYNHALDPTKDQNPGY
ncbi:MAG: RagB/SusD family nutrient uptake outer membrane protein [Prolixibacteraceae bacterium]|nr:RagB/SusD family nutrient uptake outer membrane protein [Prolixibacteraceae bacterium]